MHQGEKERGPQTLIDRTALPSPSTLAAGACELEVGASLTLRVVAVVEYS